MKSRVFIIATAILVAVMAFGGVARTGLAAEPGRSPGAEVRVDSRSLLAGMIALVELRLKSAAAALETVAATSEVRSGNWPRIKPLLATLEKHSEPLTLVYARPNGSYFTVEHDLVPYKVNDRAYFKAAMEGKSSIGEILVSRSTGRRSVVVAVPVKRGKHVSGVLAASIFLDSLSEAVSRDLDLDDESFFALDEQGKIALDRSTGWIMDDAAKMGSESMEKAVSEILANNQGTVEFLRIGRSRAVFARSELTGWKFVLTVQAQ